MVLRRHVQDRADVIHVVFRHRAPATRGERLQRDDLIPAVLTYYQPSQLTITLAATLQTLPDPEILVFGDV